MTGPWAVDKAKDAGIKYAISPLPTIEGKKMQPFLGVQMFYVSAKAKNDAFAQEFVTNYVTKKDLQLALFAAGHRPPALKAAYAEVVTTDPDVKAWYEAGAGALPMPNIPAMNSVWGPLGQATADVVAQKEAAKREWPPRRRRSWPTSRRTADASAGPRPSRRGPAHQHHPPPRRTSLSPPEIR